MTVGLFPEAMWFGNVLMFKGDSGSHVGAQPSTLHNEAQLGR